VMGDLTDAFCAMVFEDTLVRTTIIHDSLHPKWMPWACRAFCFPIQHPSSFLMLGVFDYDNPLVNVNVMDRGHQPMGRVVIHLDHFEPQTVYTMTYPLQHDQLVKKDNDGNSKTSTKKKQQVSVTNKGKGGVIVSMDVSNTFQCILLLLSLEATYRNNSLTC
jgi:hypothetical protein